MPDFHIQQGGVYTRTYYTVATLPAAASFQGEELFISDGAAQESNNYGQTATGGGTFRCRVRSDGTAWKYMGLCW